MLFKHHVEQRGRRAAVGFVPHASGNHDRPLWRRLAASSVSYCRVDAAGVPGEWVEVTVATKGQPTIVYFLDGGCGGDVLEQSRPSARNVAVATGARVLTVACGSDGKASHAAAVERGLAAYAWLLSEGCDPALTAVIHESACTSLVEGILVAASNHGLPLPAQ